MSTRRDFFSTLLAGVSCGYLGHAGLAASPLGGPWADARVEALKAGRRKVLTRTTTGVGEQVRHNPTVWGLPKDAVLVEEYTDPAADVRYLKWAHESFKETQEGCVYLVVDQSTPGYFYLEGAEFPGGPKGPTGPVGPAGAYGPVMMCGHSW